MTYSIVQQYALDVEESRAKSVDLEQFQDFNRFSYFLKELSKEIETLPDCELGRALRNQAQRLWHMACDYVASGVYDDRPLYWTRLKAQLAIRRMVESSKRPYQYDLGELLSTFDWYSRGFDDLRSIDCNRATEDIVFTGFDPFKLDINIRQSNPSGVAALYLAGRSLLDRRIVSAIYPVRYHSFDAGLVEETLSTRFGGGTCFVMTTSMGRAQFDLERYTSSRRTSTAMDNESKKASGSGSEAPKVPPESSEFLEFTLPVGSMLSIESHWPVRENRYVGTEENGFFDAYDLEAINTQTATSGSGGSFLSNEISHRVLWIKQQSGRQFPAGHLHVPQVQGYDEAMEKQIAKTVEQILHAGVSATE